MKLLQPSLFLFGLTLCCCAGASPGHPATRAQEAQSATVQEPASNQAPAEESFSPPGECVDPLVHVHAGNDQEEMGMGVRAWDDGPLDLDGDGATDEAFAPEALCGAHFANCSWNLYVTRGDCAHFVGTVDGYMEPAEARSNGLSDLRTTMSMGCVGLTYTEMKWSFDGEAYSMTAARMCYCEEQAPTDGNLDEDGCEPWR